jgi:hypothetical protein
MVNIDIPTISKMIFEVKILLSRKSFEEISGNFDLLSKNKNKIKLDMKTVKQIKDVKGILMKSDPISLVLKLSVLRKVINKRNVTMLIPNNIAPFRSNLSYDLLFLFFASLIDRLSVGINLMMMIIKQMAIGIIEKKVNLQP